MPEGQRVLIHGLGRSGTSWLMKIFDHHDMVFASHEPERFVPKPVFGAGRDAEEARAYAEGLFTSRPLRAMRKRPIRRKAFRSSLAHGLRRGLLYALTGIDRLLPGAGLKGVHVPDLAALDRAALVVKSVSHQLFLDRVAEHAPSVKVIFLIRHPCGNVFSNLTGQGQSAMSHQFLPPRDKLARLYTFDRPAETLTEAEFDQTEILAYRWSVFNDHIMRTIDGRANVRIVRYEDLCADPIARSRELFSWVGLAWQESCERFLAASLAADGDASGYHDLTRNPLIAANKWRSDMARADQQRVLEIARKSSAFRLFEAAESSPPQQGADV